MRTILFTLGLMSLFLPNMLVSSAKAQTAQEENHSSIQNSLCSNIHRVQSGNKTIVACLAVVPVAHPLALSDKKPNNCPSSKQRAPNCIYYGDCPTGVIGASAYNTNEAIFSGTATNNCGINFTVGTIRVNASIYCPGGLTPGSASSSASTGNWNNGVTFKYSFGFIGRCEVCTNHVPTDFPPFTLFGDLVVSGFVRGNTYINDPADTTNIGMSNSPAYSFPC